MLLDVMGSLVDESRERALGSDMVTRMPDLTSWCGICVGGWKSECLCGMKLVPWNEVDEPNDRTIMQGVELVGQVVFTMDPTRQSGERSNRRECSANAFRQRSAAVVMR